MDEKRIARLISEPQFQFTPETEYDSTSVRQRLKMLLEALEVLGPQPNHPCLIFKGEEIRSWPFIDTIEVGRSPSADVSIDNPHLSKRQFSITNLGNSIELTCLSSSNAVSVNGQAVKHTRTLHSGDLIETVGLCFIFVLFPRD